MILNPARFSTSSVAVQTLFFASCQHSMNPVRHSTFFVTTQTFFCGLSVLMPVSQQHTLLQYPCLHAGCRRSFKNKSGLTQHQHAKHPRVSISPPRQPTRSPTRSPTPAPPDAEDNVFPHLETEYLGPGDAVYRNYHPSMTGQCNANGCRYFL